MEENTVEYACKKDTLIITDEGKTLSFLDGIKSGISIAIGYIPIAVAFGLLAKSYDIPNYVSLLMSMLVFAGASQFIAIQLLHIGSGLWEIVLTTFMLNFRHFLMSSSLSQKIPEGMPKKVLALLSFGITDETFAVASLREESVLSTSYIIGLNTIAFLSWNAGTWLGVFAASSLPQSVRTSMGIALYSMFIALLIPAAKRSRPVFVIAAAASCVHSFLRWLPVLRSLSSGIAIIIATIIAALVGAVFFSKEVE